MWPIVKYSSSRGSEYRASKYLGVTYKQWHHCACLSHTSTRLTFYICQLTSSIRTQWLPGTFFGLASLVIILETLCFQVIKLNCRVILGAPTRVVWPLPRKSEGLLLLLFSFPRALSSSLSDPTRAGEYDWPSLPSQRHLEKSCNITTVSVISCPSFQRLSILSWFL